MFRLINNARASQTQVFILKYVLTNTVYLQAVSNGISVTLGLPVFCINMEHYTESTANKDRNATDKTPVSHVVQ
jgi:hypothetical protein